MSTPVLRRRLNTTDAVFLGLGSMIGAGVFAAFTPAAQAAGSGLLVGIVVAAIVAFANATSSAQLAAEYPESGGTYVYGRRRLGEWWGFFAGWSFIIGKTASCAAMAITFASYVAPAQWQRPLAALAVTALVIVNLLGVTRTALAARILVVLVLVALAVGIIAASSTGLPRLDELGTGGLLASGPYGILQSAGLLFFAFAGYARVATMGEEVRDPARSIPRAITIALACTVVLYAGIAVVLLGSLGASGVAASPTPLVSAARAAEWMWAVPVLQVGAALAALGALLALLAGVGRTSLAMAREHDLPHALAAVHPRFGVPYRAELLVGIVVVALVLTLDLRGAIGFSSFGVLLYYFVANLSAWTQSREHRRYPRTVQAVGVVGCLALVVTLPLVSVLVGLGVLAVGVVYRVVRLRISRPPGV